MSKPLHFWGYRTTSRQRAIMMLVADVVGWLVFCVPCAVRRLRGRSFRPESVQSIAVFRLDGIGDLVLSTSALAALRELFPNARITLFVNRWAVGLAELVSGPDMVVALEAPQFGAFKGKSGVLRSLLDELLFVRRLGRERRFDLGIDLRGDLLSILPAFCLGPRFLFSRPSRAGGFLLTNVIRHPEEGKISESALNVALVEKIAARRSGRQDISLRLPPADALDAAQMHLPAGVLDGRYVCLAVAAPYEARCYAPENWGEVVRLLRARHQVPFVILGSAAEKERCAAVVECCGTEVYNLAGLLTLVETAACMAGCCLFIGNDGGLMHVARAYKRPMVQLFGPASSVVFGYRGKSENILQAFCPLNPCAEAECSYPDGRKCMDRINPSEVARISASIINITQ